MSIEQIFTRFTELMAEKHTIEKSAVIGIWNKNSFCLHILSAGKNKGSACNKKCVKDELYCRSHSKNDL